MRVLIVDDERALAQTLRQGLEGEGFVVDLAHDGQHGLTLATYGTYDVLVLDIMLPRRNGYDVLKELRARTANSTRPTPSSSAPMTISSNRSASRSSSRGCGP